MTDKTPFTVEPETVPDNERTWATIVHLSALAEIIFSILIFIVPLVVWLLKRHHMPFVDEQGKEAVN